MKDKVCCAIVTYNCDEKFMDTFNSVIKQVDKVVIIDNGSNKKTLDMLNNLKLNYDIKLILCNDNIGIAAALNKGIKYAEENNYYWILTLDHDSILDQNMVKNLLETYYNLSQIERKKVVSLLPRYIEAGLDIDEQLKEKKDDISYVIGGITSGNLVKLSCFKDIGLFDEKLFIDFVDFDFCFRVREKGYEIIEVSKALLFHTVGNVKEAKFLWKNIIYSNHSAIRRYYITRNRRYCWERYKDIASDFIKADKDNDWREIVKIVLYEDHKYSKIKMVIRGILDYKRNKFGKYI